MYCVLNKLSEYMYFYISKIITSYTFLLVFKIVENLQCILSKNFCMLEIFCYSLIVVCLETDLAGNDTIIKNT